MATPYSNVYDAFLSKVSDFQLLNSLSQTELEDNMHGWMVTSVAKFYRCRTDLTMDDVNNQFINTLTNLEVEIIGTMMVIEYLKPKVNTTQTMQMQLSDTDFKMYSQANQITALLNLYGRNVKDADVLMSQYTFLMGDMSQLT